MRIYLPATPAQLRRIVATGEVRPVSGIGFGVTDALRAEYPGADDEELEYLAMTDAARASLRLLAADGVGDAVPGDANSESAPSSGDRAMRVVIAADTDDATEYPQGDRAAVRLSGPLPWRSVAAVHLDGADAAPAVLAAIEAVDAADLGDLDAEFAVGEATSYELAWYAPDEIEYLIGELG
ncbi:DUF6912 family protein [Nakamurella lactea]|uniref:DUF6912 family protein n=1 Tax=Nakamurella lactea TaxID=459515 RepID=UPI0003FCDDA5|nr:hypothetical protein [Nakamurella lactea]